MVTMTSCRRLALALSLLSLHYVECFTPSQQQMRGSPLAMNFLKDMFSSAFENDPSLSRDKSKGQLEGPNDVPAPFSYAPTQVQQKWRQSSQNTGAKLNARLLENTRWTVDLFLTGVPAKDPSNDLFGTKVNISSRDRTVGLNLPDKPSVSVEVEFLPDGVCKTLASPFTTGEIDGQWKLSDDASMLRFSMDVVGYSRTVQTKGSITKVYWSDEEEKTRQTSSTYRIPPGFIFLDFSIGYGSQPGTLKMKNGVLRVEQNLGFLGAASKMVPCGAAAAKCVKNDQ